MCAVCKYIEWFSLVIVNAVVQVHTCIQLNFPWWLVILIVSFAFQLGADYFSSFFFPFQYDGILLKPKKR